VAGVGTYPIVPSAATGDGAPQTTSLQYVSGVFHREPRGRFGGDGGRARGRRRAPWTAACPWTAARARGRPARPVDGGRARERCRGGHAARRRGAAAGRRLEQTHRPPEPVAAPRAGFGQPARPPPVDARVGVGCPLPLLGGVGRPNVDPSGSPPRRPRLSPAGAPPSHTGCFPERGDLRRVASTTSAEAVASASEQRIESDDRNSLLVSSFSSAVRTVLVPVPECIIPAPASVPIHETRRFRCRLAVMDVFLPPPPSPQAAGPPARNARWDSATGNNLEKLEPAKSQGQERRPTCLTAGRSTHRSRVRWRRILRRNVLLLVNGNC